MPITFSGARRRALLLPLLFLLSLAPASAQRVDRNRAVRLLRQPNVATQFIVKFYDPEIAPDADALASFAPGGIRSLHAIGDSGLHLLQTNRGDADVLTELSQHPAVEFIEPDYIVTADRTSNDPQANQVWALGSGAASIGAPLAWNVTTGSRSIAVGVLDTGADLTHPDLAANLWRSPAAFTLQRNGATVTCPAGSPGYDFVNNDCLPADDNGHGTHISGSIGALGNNGVGVVGVNWQTSIISFKFLGANGSGSSSDAIAAIDLAIALRTRFPSEANLRILNNSWGGGGFSTALAQAISRARQNGILMVFAAGNEARNNDGVSGLAAYVQSFDNIIAVAASDSNDNLASFSNFGATSVHLAAPGVGIVSTHRNGSYATFSGSSMATAYVSGAAALLLSACPVSTSEARTLLITTVDARLGLTGRVSTGGRLNVDRAIQRCASGAVALDVAPSSRTVSSGGSVTFNLTPRSLGTVNAQPTIQITGAPAGVTLVRSGTTAFSTTETLTANVSSSVAAGTYTLLASLTAGTFRASTPLTLTVQPPPTFTLQPFSGTARLTQGSQAFITVGIARENGFTAPVAVRLANLPSGLTATDGTIPSGANSVVIPLTVPVTATVGRYTLNVVANSTQPAISKFTTLTFEIAAQPISLLLSAPSLITMSRGRAVSFPILLQRTGNATKAVTVTVTGLPAGVTVSALTIPAGATSGNLTLRVATNAAVSNGVSLRFVGTMADPALTAVVNTTLRIQ
jgi:subtilisin family serine protease